MRKTNKKYYERKNTTHKRGRVKICLVDSDIKRSITLLLTHKWSAVR